MEIEEKYDWVRIRTNNGEWISEIHATIFQKLDIDYIIENTSGYYTGEELRTNGLCLWRLVYEGKVIREEYDEKTGEVCLWVSDKKGEGLLQLDELEDIAKKSGKQLVKNYSYDEDGEIFLWCYTNDIEELRMLKSQLRLF